MKVIELRNVSVAIDQKKLLEDISFSIKQGSITALLGHNGAGKSTLMKTIIHMLEYQTGTIEIMERYEQKDQLLAYKKQLAFLPEEPMLLPELTVEQHFQLYGKSYQMPEKVVKEKTTAWTKEFEINHKLSAYPDELSKGMKQKVQTICALLPDVPLLLIDEPFMGLDIYAGDYLIRLLKEKVAAGTAILMTTHQLEQARELADHFILLQQGKIVEAGSITEFDSITRGSFHG